MMKPAYMLAAALTAASLAGPVRAEDPTAATVVATVDGQDITLGQMIVAREALPEQYRSLPDDVLFNGLLDQLVQQFTLAKIGEGEQTEADRLAIENQARGYLAGIVLSKVADAAVTDAALQTLYDQTYAKAEPATEYHAAHILVASEDEAKAVKAEIDGGADFAAIASEKSSDPGSAANGGDLGWFGTGMMVQPFETAVIAMAPGTVSDPVQTDFGWHVIRLIETRPAAVPAFEEVREQLAGDLRQQAVEAKVKEVTDAAKVERKTDGIDPAVIKDTALIGLGN